MHFVRGWRRLALVADLLVQVAAGQCGHGTATAILLALDAIGAADRPVPAWR